MRMWGAVPSLALLAAPPPLRKTVEVHLPTEGDDIVVISLPDVLGALTLKGGAYRADSRDRDRHLLDGAMLAATVEDADALLEAPEKWTGSDARRIRNLAEAWKRSRTRHRTHAPPSCDGCVTTPVPIQAHLCRILPTGPIAGNIGIANEKRRAPRVHGASWWRWRESNPRPTVVNQGFSGCSLLVLFSAPVALADKTTDGLSHLEVPVPPMTKGTSKLSG